MPNTLNLSGQPGDDLAVTVRMPLWLKQRVAEAASAIGMTFADFVRMAIRERAELEATKAAGRETGRKAGRKR